MCFRMEIFTKAVGRTEKNKAWVITSGQMRKTLKRPTATKESFNMIILMAKLSSKTHREVFICSDSRMVFWMQKMNKIYTEIL